MIRRNRVCAAFSAVAMAMLLLTTARTVTAQSGSRGMSPHAPPPAPKAESKGRLLSPYYAPRNGKTVHAVAVTGNRRIPEARILGLLKTKAGRTFDPQLVQSDVRSLISSGLFHDVNTFTDQGPQGGIIVRFDVMERPIIGHIRFVGNRVKDKHLLKQIGLKVGQALNAFEVREGKRKLDEYYREKGYTDAVVSITEGERPGDVGVTYRIQEGAKKRIWKTKFTGNTIVRDGRLKTQIQSKPGILWLFKGKVDYDAIDEDLDRLTAYYRGLGFFQAKVEHEMKFDDDGEWLNLTFHIDEGPRFRVRDIRFVGNQKISTADLASRVEMERGAFFNLAQLRRDEVRVNEAYGSQGYIASKIVAEPRFLEEPGMLDMVYKIEEGEQYRVGRIIVNIEGDQAQTRRSVVHQRLSFRPGDIVDITKIKNSERRLQASQLFVSDPSQGQPPSIAVKPTEMTLDATTVADRRSRRQTQPRRSTFRGQGPSR